MKFILIKDLTLIQSILLKVKDYWALFGLVANVDCLLFEHGGGFGAWIMTTLFPFSSVMAIVHRFLEFI